jgi:hypothetical protein
MHDIPAASVPGPESPALTRGQAGLPVLFRLKFEEMFGLVPMPGTSNAKGAFPTFSNVTVCGLSALVVFGAVGEKLRLGGSTKSSLSTRLLYVSEM